MRLQNRAPATRVLLLDAPADANFIPGLANRLGCIAVEFFLGHVDGDVGKLEKCAALGNLAASHRLPPNLARLFPRIAAKGRGDEVKGLVGNARVYVDAAVVLVRVLEILHVVYLRILALWSC